MSEIACPSCSSKVTSKPFKKWQFRGYDVGRYACGKCEIKFNLYKSTKSTFTIPKAKVAKK